MRQAVPMHDQIRQRYEHTPEQWLADGGSRVRQISAEFARFWSRKSLQINELTL
jgi:hypothetical protein